MKPLRGSRLFVIGAPPLVVHTLKLHERGHSELVVVDEVGHLFPVLRFGRQGVGQDADGGA
jgi:hypothetical protein